MSKGAGTITVQRRTKGKAMAGNDRQKLKLLHLYRMLEQETDAEHGLTMTQILQRLADVGIVAERKSIYRDLDVLRSFGMKVTTIQRAPVEYVLERTGMTLPELMLLIDAVQSSKFLSQRTSDRLVERIRGLASMRERELLDKAVHVDGRIKSQNESVFHNVDAIHEAMRLKRKVSFLYYKYGPDMKRRIQHDGKPYVLTPVQIVFSGGFYYLVAWSDAHEGFANYRIDRMRMLQVTDERAARNERIANYAYQDFAYQSFGMFDGEIVQAKLRVQDDAMDIVVDRFGRGVPAHPRKDGSTDVSVTVRKSAQFFGWVAGMDGAVGIAGPKALVAEYRAWLKKLAKG